jgi:hypothetical protein
MTIRLFRKFRYNVEDKEREVTESHYSDYFINIGYKGQIYFITIEKLEVAEILCYGDLLWCSKF